MLAAKYSIAAGINPDAEKEPPPAPTLVYFPQNDVELKSSDEWIKNPSNLFKQYSHITKPSDVRLLHLEALNINIENDVGLDVLLPPCSDGYQYLPPRDIGQNAPAKQNDRKVSLAPVAEAFSAGKGPLLANGVKAPDHDMYVKLLKELTCENEDALRSIARRKPRPGHPAPNFSYFRKFWSHLELVFAYWDTSLDNYYDINDQSLPEPPKSPKGLKRLSIALSSKEPVKEAIKPKSSKRYTGRRISTGSRMPENFRIDTIRTFVEPLAFMFGCQMVNPRRVPQMQIRSLLIPVTQTSQVWRIPQDKSQIKRGITEGPVLGIQCRAETSFMKDKNMAVLDSAREVAGLLLLAQERAREGKTKEIPGQGKWYTTVPRWGGGPGGEFGEAEGNKDEKLNHHHHHFLGRRHSLPSSVSGGSKGPSEEEIWKELKSGPSLWDPRHTYLAVGKDRGEPHDNVFMVTALFHHLAILKLQVHPLYIDYLISGKLPQSPPQDIPWHAPRIQRSPWFDLFDPQDRSEALRAVWGIMAYSMRSGDSVGGAAGQRQKSEVHHHFPFRKKSNAESQPTTTARSQSVAF